MDNTIATILSIAVFLNAVTTIVTFIKNSKKRSGQYNKREY